MTGLFQHSVPCTKRSVLAVVLAASALIGSAGCASLLGEPEPADAVRQIERSGAAVSERMPHVSVFIPKTSDHREKNFGDAELRAIVPALHRLDDLRTLDLSGTSITDDSLGQIKTLQSLERVDLWNTAATIHGLLLLVDLPRLHMLVIGANSLSDADLAKLRKRLSGVEIYLENKEGEKITKASQS